ncbi:TetR family transcriptional regulator [Streptomyces sp. NPDC048251]|uniref:TetR/AcrR family transcriptional regulator n=1 Tax=Streptomyces sp. NPDC048251 TaxID=3154501 RepID=UPI00342AFE9D
MRAEGAARPGLRERKKIKLRRNAQIEAFRLFEAQGYGHTTVEQIAAAAEISTATFYRYFPTKEDVVFGDEYDSAIEAVLSCRPADEPLVATVQAVTAVLATAAETDRKFNLARLRLIATVPALEARYASQERRSVDLFSDLFARRTGLASTDYQVQLTAAAFVAVLFTASRQWAKESAAGLGVLVREATTTIEPLLTALDHAHHDQPG